MLTRFLRNVLQTLKICSSGGFVVHFEVLIGVEEQYDSSVLKRVICMLDKPQIQLDLELELVTMVSFGSFSFFPLASFYRIFV
jgi:hypothetical protein